MLIYARLDALQGSPPGGSPPGAGPEESVNVFHLPAQALALLVGIPAGLFLLGGAASLWEKRLREKRRAREKESMREALGRIPTEGAFRDDSGDDVGDGFGDGPRDSSGR